ncbi:P43 5S RNA-binding protein-like isoform X2 [Takifugu rubripes]|uniref:P43 5S RNA-binding protein-like isoform X2 n=1 Tax=Takifugu rubripes TaxID=31033 RepID=UPI001145CF92|nr:P43 5S RNA-binding protein-like isoform X2 [Takifugu rubripes]
MDGVRGARTLQLFNCTHANCGAAFTRQWRLKEHETVHTGARPCQCAVAGCGRRFSRKSHLSRHMLQHRGVKQFKCKVPACNLSFFNAGKLKRHVRYRHEDKNKYFKCNQPNCSLTFRKRKMFKEHLKEHNDSANFKCTNDGCGATFSSHAARKAHEKKHAGYRCPHADCPVLAYTWGKLQKHVAKHPARFTCQVCKKVFKKVDLLRRHKRIHASHKPVLVCPREDCQAYFSTTFNLQHHIRKESMSRHLLHHDADAGLQKKRHRPKKTWQKRLDGHHLPLVEEDLRRLFALRMRVSRRAKVETNLSGLFNERKIPRYVDPEVNLRSLFALKKPQIEKPVA